MSIWRQLRPHGERAGASTVEGGRTYPHQEGDASVLKPHVRSSNRLENRCLRSQDKYSKSGGD